MLLVLAACMAVPTCTEVLTTNCATPTPTVMWDNVVDSDLAGYKVYAEEAGGPLTLIATLPCEFRPVFLDGDDIPDATYRFCPGADMAIPVTRFLNQGKVYDITVKAYNTLGHQSFLPSFPVTICMPPTYTVGSGLPYE